LKSRGEIDAYLASNFIWAPCRPNKTPTFADCVAASKVGMVIVSPDITRDLHFADDATWQLFLNRPEAMGFRLLATKETFRIFVRDGFVT
jgi:hypothetical protein